MSIDYVREKLYVAVNTLATSAAPLGKRLEYAWIGALIRLKPDDFPPEQGEEFAALYQLCTTAPGTPDPAEGSIAHAMRTRSEEELTSIAERIWELFSAICDPLFIDRQSEPEEAPAKAKKPRKKQ